MDNNNLNIKDLNNKQQPNMEVKQLKILEQPELTEQITTEEAQYRYLKELINDFLRMIDDKYHAKVIDIISNYLNSNNYK